MLSVCCFSYYVDDVSSLLPAQAMRQFNAYDKDPVLDNMYTVFVFDCRLSCICVFCILAICGDGALTMEPIFGKHCGPHHTSSNLFRVSPFSPTEAYYNAHTRAKLLFSQLLRAKDQTRPPTNSVFGSGSTRKTNFTLTELSASSFAGVSPQLSSTIRV